MKLGHVCSHIRNRGSYSHIRDQLDSIGFEWIKWKNREFRGILESLAEMQLEELQFDFQDFQDFQASELEDSDDNSDYEKDEDEGLLTVEEEDL